MGSRIGVRNLSKRTFWRSVGRFFSGTATHFRLGFRNKREIKYYYNFALGVVYNEFLKSAHQRPNKQAYRIGQEFHKYVLSIDPFLDDPSFSPRVKKRITLPEIKGIPTSSKNISNFVLRVKQSNLSREQKREIMRAVNSFRQTAAKGVNMTFADPFADFSVVLKGIELTGGKMYGTWAEIVALAHGIGVVDAKRMHKSFSSLSTSMQFVDDALDCLKDFGVQQNLFISLSKRDSIEFSRLKQEAKKRQKISFSWLKKRFPNTFKIYEREFRRTILKIPEDEETLRRFTYDSFFGW